MSLYRCAACGSPNVVRDTVGGGFDYKKAAVGTIVFGAVGAVAGMDGKQTTVFKCPACGQTLTYDMNFETKYQIDQCVMSAEARKQYPWERLKQRYPNIEATPLIDQQMQQETQDAQSAIMSAIKEFNDEYDSFATLTKEELDADEALCEEKKSALLRKLEDEANVEYQKQLAEMEGKKQQLLSETRERKQKKQAEIEMDKQTIAQQSVSKAPAVFLLLIIAFIVIFLVGAEVGGRSFYALLSPVPVLGNLARSLAHGNTTVLVGALALVFILLIWFFGIVGKGAKMDNFKKKLSAELPDREQELAEIVKREDDILNHPENIAELKVESVKERVDSAKRYIPSFPSKRKRLEVKLDRNEARTLMADIIELFFTKFKGEIRSKQLEEYMRSTIPENLHEKTFREGRGRGRYTLTELRAAFGGTQGRLKCRTIETDIAAEHDTFFSGHAYLNMWSLEDKKEK